MATNLASNESLPILPVRFLYRKDGTQGYIHNRAWQVAISEFEWRAARLKVKHDAEEGRYLVTLAEIEYIAATALGEQLVESGRWVDEGNPL